MRIATAKTISVWLRAGAEFFLACILMNIYSLKKIIISQKFLNGVSEPIIQTLNLTCDGGRKEGILREEGNGQNSNLRNMEKTFYKYNFW